MSDQENPAAKFANLMEEADINENNWQDKVAELLKQVAEANQKAESNWEQLLRKEAECQNIQRRSTQEVENASKFAIERLADELLHVVDNFERALDTPLTPAEDDKNLIGFIEGIKLTQKGLIDTLGKFGITQLNPLGEAFDPQFHEALSTQENNDVASDTVLAVYSKGYLLKGRLLRPARVVVSRAGTSD